MRDPTPTAQSCIIRPASRDRRNPRTPLLRSNLSVQCIMEDCSNSGFSLASKLCLMQLACVAAGTDRGVQLHRDAWPTNAHYWLDTRYAPRVLHFSAFHYTSAHAQPCKPRTPNPFHSPSQDAGMAVLFFLRDHHDLRPFLLSSARATGRTIGCGSYGSVEEVAIPGTVCAAKKIHDFFQDPRQMSREGIEKAATEFARECQLMSTLRHPHIVQFLGVCFLPGSRMPALVMEKLATSLHDILDPEPSPPTKPFIPVSLKRSVLHDVGRGLSFLHSHSPPIIHPDLSARNVLLSEGMVAKIADLGMARIVPSLRASTMTIAPGASIYMPPEALEDKSRYDTTIDIFPLEFLQFLHSPNCFRTLWQLLIWTRVGGW